MNKLYAFLASFALITNAYAQVTPPPGSGTQYTDGAAAPTHVTGPTMTFNNGGTMTGVSAANALPITGNITTTSQPSFQATTGTISTPTGSVVATSKQYSTVIVQVSGTYSTFTGNFKESFDNGVTYVAAPLTLVSTTPGAPVSTFSPANNSQVVYQGNLEGATNFEIVGSALASGSVSVVINLTANPVTTSLTAAITNNPTIQGIAANNASQSGNPLNNGGTIITAAPTAGTNGQAKQNSVDAEGYTLSRLFCNKENCATACVTTTTATNTSLVAAAGSGVKIYLMGYSVDNSGSTGDSPSFTSGSGGSTIWRTTNPPTFGGANYAIPISGAATAANTALFVTTAAASTSEHICVAYYTGS